MKTIAEFVEDAGTVSLLRELGVDYSQGYHHGRPVPVGLADAAEQLSQQRGQVPLLGG